MCGDHYEHTLTANDDHLKPILSKLFIPLLPPMLSRFYQIWIFDCSEYVPLRQPTLPNFYLRMIAQNDLHELKLSRKKQISASGY